MKKFKLITILAIVSLFTTACADVQVNINPEDNGAKADENGIVEIDWVENADDATEKLTTYEGRVLLEGWVDYVPAYVGEPEAHFHVAENSMSKLPQKLQDLEAENYNLRNNYPEIIEKIEAHSEAQPAKILADEIMVYLEGSPYINVVEVVE